MEMVEGNNQVGDDDHNLPNAKISLNHHILDYMKRRRLTTSANVFENESKAINEDRRVKVTAGKLETQWELYSDIYLRTTNNTYLEECAKYGLEFYDTGYIQTNPARAARLNTYILGYMRSESFTNSAAAFAQEAQIMEDSSLQENNALLSNFWILIDSVSSIPLQDPTQEPSTSSIPLQDPTQEPQASSIPLQDPTKEPQASSIRLQHPAQLLQPSPIALQHPTQLPQPSPIALQDLSFREIQTLYKDMSFKITTCHFSTDGKLLAFGGTDRKVSVWDMDSNMTLLTTPRQPGVITDVRFQPHSKSFAFSCYDKIIRLWDVNKTGAHPVAFHGHTCAVMSVDFCPTKPHIICSSDIGGEMRLWDVDSGDMISNFKGADIISKAVRFQSKEMLAAALGSQIMLLSIAEEGMEIKIDQYLKGHVEDIRSICWKSSRTCLASVSHDGARVWSSTNGRWTNDYSLVSNGHKFEACEFHPRHPSLLLIGSPQYIHVWDFTHGDETRIFLSCTGLVYALTGSPETGLIASASRDSQVKLWR